MEHRATDKTVERTVLLLLAALVLFATPVIFAWAQDASPWYVPYLLWATIIAGCAWISARRKDA